MISSFFGKTKPLGHIVLSVSLFLLYFTNALWAPQGLDLREDLPVEVMSFAVLLMALVLINLTVKSEKLTEPNSYAMLFFVLLCAVFPENLTHKNALLANVFVLLALWRLLSIKSIKLVKQKIFDASMLVAVASLFYDWALAFLLLVLRVINIYDRKNFKNWLVPLVGVATVFVISFTFLKVNTDLAFFSGHYRFSTGILQAVSLEEVLSTKALVYMIFVLLVALVLYLRWRRQGSGKLLQLRIVLMAFLLGVAITLFTPVDAPPLMITYFPASVLMANYFEGIKKTRLQDLILLATILFSLAVFTWQHKGMI